MKMLTNFPSPALGLVLRADRCVQLLVSPEADGDDCKLQIRFLQRVSAMKVNSTLTQSKFFLIMNTTIFLQLNV